MHMTIPNLVRDFAGEIIPINSLSSMDNEFIPVHCLKGSKALEAGCVKTLLYEFYMYTGRYREITQFNRFGTQMLVYDATWYKLKHSTITRRYICNYGILIDATDELKYKPLIMLCLKKEYAFSADKTNPSPTNFCVVIDRSLIRDEENFKLYRNIKKSYIDVIEQDIDVMYTNNIENICLKSMPLELPKLKTLTEVVGHYKSLNKYLKKGLDIPEKPVPLDLPF